MTEAKTTLVSLGMSCQTAHQLALFAEQNPNRINFIKSPFDWLICPPLALANWLEADLVDFKPDEIVEHRAHAYWPRFDFWFWHGFMDRNNDTRILNIPSNTSRELAKLAYQRDTFRGLDPANTVFVISNTQNNLTTDVFGGGEQQHYEFTAPVMARFQKTLDGFFGSPTSLHWMTRADRCAAEIADAPNLHRLPSESSDWKGSQKDWGEVLGNIIGL